MLYLGPNEVTGLKKSKQFLLVVRSLCRIRVPLVVMKIEKFKDLFRAALDRW